MEKDILEKYVKAGRIAAEALQYGASLIKPGANWIEVADKIEAKIHEMGGEIAFPAQMSMNDTAAHFIPLLGEEVIFKDQVVCLDVGVHVDGYVGDNALTIDLSGKYQKLVEASRKALVEAIKIIKPGLEIREIGKKIHEVITRYGYSPIRNLSGHGVDKYKIHTKPSMPNYDNGDTTKLEEGQAIAIEPFASTGAGVIYESGQANIYMLIKKKPVRNTMTREVLAEIEKMKGLPFTLRWLVKKFGEGKTKFAIREMTNYGMLTEFPPLVDKNHGIVSQAENTIIVTTDGAKITTKS